MKNRTIAILAVLFSCNFAFANTIAEVTTSGGFFRQDPGKSGIRIDSSGAVTAFDKQGQKTIATLSEGRVRGLQYTINRVTPAELENEDPKRPRCMDAPRTSFKVFRTDGVAIEIAAYETCLSLFIPTTSKALYDVLKGLRSLNTLAYE